MKKFIILLAGLIPMTAMYADSDLEGVCGDKIEITATPQTGYHFVRWSDGSTEQTRVVDVASDTVYRASFAINEYTITVLSEDGGTAIGGGTFPYGTRVTITATADECYLFKQWQDGDTDAERTVVVTEDMTFTAQFEAEVYTIRILSDDPTMGGAVGRKIE